MSGNDLTALVVVDVQNDFCAGGALPVPNAERVVSALNQYIDDAVANGVTVYASRDWHPAVSNHFRPFGGPWPVHCVGGTDGARFHPNIRLPATAIVITKGDGSKNPGYSAFEGHTPDGKRFLTDLRERGITQLFVGGLATDYCVKHSVLDALAAGFQVTLLARAIAGVDPEDSAQAILDMRQSGARMTAAHDVFLERNVVS